MINIGNLRHTQIGIKCDRTTILGNPFELVREADRNDVISAFRQYLYLVTLKNIQPIDARAIVYDRYQQSPKNLYLSHHWQKSSGSQIIDRLNKISRLDNITLLCWCYPLACHCDVLKSYLEFIILPLKPLKIKQTDLDE